MQGALRRQARSSARSFFLLPSVLALLALALFPVVANAETSAGATYEVEVPTVKSEPATKPKKEHKSVAHNESSNNAKAEGSGAKVGTGESSGGTGAEVEGQGSSEEGTSQKKEKNPSTGGGGGGGNNSNGGGGAKPEGGGGAKAEGSVSSAKPVASPAASHSSGGSSSPVVPILIAVAVLAAISIGVVLYRQRKSGAGPDGRVSSPNAS